MKKLTCIALLFFTINKAGAQQDYTGAYYLRGVAETASGFQLKADSTFIFFFSYGGLDRTGKGKWSVRNDRIIFNSRPYPGKDFRLVQSKKIAGDSITIKVWDENKMLPAYVYSGLRKGNVFPTFKNNPAGIIKFAQQDFDAIGLQFEFAPERLTSFTALPAQHNYFEFTFEEWMMEVFMQDFSLSIEGNELKGHHPLDSKGAFTYQKE